MARPKGSKNKPKVVKITQAQATLANKLGLTTEQFAKEKLKLDRKPRKPRSPKINWEALAKNLQQALAAEIKENDELRDQNTKLLTQSIKLLGAIEYLETKRGNN